MHVIKLYLFQMEVACLISSFCHFVGLKESKEQMVWFVFQAVIMCAVDLIFLGKKSDISNLNSSYVGSGIHVASFNVVGQQGWESLVSQNPSMAGAGRALCGSPSPAPCPSRVTQSRGHSTAARRGWNISRDGDSTASLGSLGQGSVTLRGKKFFLIFSWSFLCSSLCPLPLVLSLGTTGKSLAPSS